MDPTARADGIPTPPTEAFGAVLAGGRGSRLGGAKPTAMLAGRPLISYPLDAFAAAGIEAFVVAKADTDLCGRPLVRQTDLKTTATGGPDQRTTAPALGGVEVVIEPDEPTHPLAGIVAALLHASRPLVVLGCDFPFAPPALLRALAEAPEPLVVPAPGGDPQPLMARWAPELLPRLEDALGRQEPLRRTVAALAPRLLDDTELARFGDPARAFFNVNTPADLGTAEEFV
ncbi:MAG TPA: molybdenum cofactor guanylyltransferase [Solirubrobacterales bacterium]